MIDYEFKTKPFKHQLDFFKKYRYKDIVALNADMGVGKSKMAIDMLSFRYLEGHIDRVIIIAPNGVHAQWLDEQFPEHCPCKYEGLVYTSKRTNKELKKQDRFFLGARYNNKLHVLTINIQSFARDKGLELVNRFFRTATMGCAVVVDEASTIKTPDIKTTKNIKKIRDSYPQSIRLTMTGTPAAKGPVNLWSIYDFLKEDYMGCSYIAFKMRHTVTMRQKRKVKGRLMEVNEPISRDIFDKVKKWIGLQTGEIDYYKVEHAKNLYGLSTSNFWEIYNSKEYQKYKNIDSLLKHIEPDTFMISKADCLELPPKIKIVEKFPLNPEQKRLIGDLKDYAVAVYQGEELTVEIKALLGLRVLQICGGFFSHNTDIEGQYEVIPISGKNYKLDYIKHDLGEVGNQQSIIWAVYTPEIELIYKTLEKDYNVGMLYGESKGSHRDDTVKRFKKGEIQHLIANPAVGAYGFNFQNARIQYWYSRNYFTDKRIQAEERSYRIGTVESPVYKDLLYDIKFEHIVYSTLQAEMDINKLFITNNSQYVERENKPLTLDDIFGI